MRRFVRLALAVTSCAVVLSTGCEPEIGLPCDSNQKEVLGKVQVKAGINDLVRDVSFDNCSQALCASVDGGRPYCTKECEADIECAEAGPGFTCQQVVTFGALACTDFTPADLCDADGNGDGFPCDCLDAEGQPSTRVKKYCSAAPGTLAARDEEFGRAPFAP
jgi:hypothetical protein